jgi:AraC-like DNA-binding protein
MLSRLALGRDGGARLSKVLHFLRLNFAQPLRIEQMAEVAHMSPSSFHRHFKAWTSVTPLQFQKQLRLKEARRWILAGVFNVQQAAHHVGYESSSQFSRDYSRMFGHAPKHDICRSPQDAKTRRSRECVAQDGAC